MTRFAIFAFGRRAARTLRQAAFLLLLHAGSAHALDADQQHAKALLVRLCGQCHAVGRTGQSPHPDAPPFRTFGDAKLYDEDFGKRLRDGLSTMHPDMPTFHFNQRDSEAAVSYLRAIQDPRRPK